MAVILIYYFRFALNVVGFQIRYCAQDFKFGIAARISKSSCAPNFWNEILFHSTIEIRFEKACPSLHSKCSQRETLWVWATMTENYTFAALLLVLMVMVGTAEVPEVKAETPSPTMEVSAASFPFLQSLFATLIASFIPFLACWKSNNNNHMAGLCSSRCS